MFETFQISPSNSIHTAAVEYDRMEEMFHFLVKNEVNMSHLQNISNDKIKAEWLFIREIICKAMATKEDIVYDEHRKPTFKISDSYLSISHSNERVAISIDKKYETGIDLQFITDKIVRIKSKFLNSIEQSLTSQNPTELTCYWSIKEALFKIYGKKDAFLKENFEVQQFKFDGTKGSAIGVTRAAGKEKIQPMEFRKMENYVMAYSVNY
ncbi:4'-phosphopantetheinyl transferase superfamily protein [Vicingaceae bacterium]|nr:4'-phosphopantetheinyl transferase superfamily protein [Vicingaceae bacterium]MDB4060914.1 4'-phosphopantetheinyl transferase superfamily protein [Vicingaceae bacterium]MDC0004838.1 4'-phosphopantetheinyl transferase superfamily protein [bacterium]MDC1450855.1 4'-phosphopantetheinyl transferase superfamily protein [Vicingaceae bacterium]